MEGYVEQIAKKSEDMAKWYTDVVLKAELADYAPIKGCMVIRPYGYRIWENLKSILDKYIKDTGHQNAYFPLFIPESLLQKEAEHVEGFAPEVAWVTHGGKEKLNERLAIRPTSEAIICAMYSKWVKSWRDLPILLNQWANVVRWEKTTRPFLRTTEFLWQEGHTVHRTKEEAMEEVLKMLNVYKKFLEEDLAIPVLAGKKTKTERFAGAEETYTVEALMPDGQSLQAGTSHYLGQHFAKVFDIKFTDKDGTLKYVHQTSWGVSTRLVGALIMMHGDDRGLRLPPRIAPYQVVIVPIYKEENKEKIISEAKRLEGLLKGSFRVILDDREKYTPGWKFNEWELKGVPVRIELGPKDVERNGVTIFRRDTCEKVFISFENLVKTLGDTLVEVQSNLFKQAEDHLKSHIFSVTSLDEVEEVILKKKGIALCYWCGNADCEKEIKSRYGATSRCIENENAEKGKCVVCGKETTVRVYFARAY